MKHISRLSTHTPLVADEVQDFICLSAQTLAQMAELKGDRSWLLEFANDKCDPPAGDAT